MKPKDCCYEEMTKSVGGQSELQPFHDEPMRNEYENTRKENNNWNWYGSKGKE